MLVARTGKSSSPSFAKPVTFNLALGDGLISQRRRRFITYPSLPLIAYVTLNAPAFNAVAQLGRMGMEDVVLHHFDDAPERFRERVEQVEGNALTHSVIDAISDRLKQLPRKLSVAVENLFDQPHRYMSALDLGMEAGIAIVSVYRNLETAQLGSPKRLVIAAKVLRGFSYLRDPGYSVEVSISPTNLRDILAALVAF